MRAAIFLFLAGSVAFADKDQPSPSKPADKPKPSAAESAKALEDFRIDAGAYVIRLASRPNDKLKLHEGSLFHWGNPARNGEDGAVFVWTLDGRPEVIGSVFTYRFKDSIRRKHEYHSLAAGPLTAEYQGERVWAPQAAGVSFQAVPDAPEPAPMPRGRLTQMKMVAREFSAGMEDQNGQKSDLRLIPQPLLHYEPKSKETIDGALFSFSLGTDPEVILLLEARVKKDQPQWQFAFARFHYISLAASYKNKEVWHVEPLPDITGLNLGDAKYQESVYATYHTKTTPVAE